MSTFVWLSQKSQLTKHITQICTPYTVDKFTQHNHHGADNNDYSGGSRIDGAGGGVSASIDWVEREREWECTGRDD